MKTIDLGRQIPPVDRVLFGTKILNKGPILEGPRAEKSDKKTPISTQPKSARVSDDADSRSDPTFTCASPGLAVARPNSLKLTINNNTIII